MEPVTAEQRIYQIRDRRPLLYGDPKIVKGASGLWAAPGEFVDASHPVLRVIIKGQLHKVRALKPGDVIPEGAVFHGVDDLPPAVRAMCGEYDRLAGGEKPVTAEEMVVGKDGSAVPTLAPDLSKTDDDDPGDDPDNADAAELERLRAKLAEVQEREAAREEAVRKADMEALLEPIPGVGPDAVHAPEAIEPTTSSDVPGAPPLIMPDPDAPPTGELPPPPAVDPAPPVAGDPF